ncbi:MAG: type II toxin-antitoxin system RelE/ParE family toxin [Steroidobacteraceae bacterium]
MSSTDKPLAWLHGEIKTPPFGPAARLEAGMLLRKLQRGVSIGMPHSRPLPVIGRRCHELCIKDEQVEWRVVYRTDRDAIVIGEVFAKKTRTTSKDVIANCKWRFREYDNACK